MPSKTPESVEAQKQPEPTSERRFCKPCEPEPGLFSATSIADFTDFMAEVGSRLAKGQQTYGDSFLRRPIPELLDEIKEELLDVCAWSFLLWLRLQGMQCAEEQGKEVSQCSGG